MKLLQINSEARMLARRSSCFSIVVLAFFALAMGCRGTGPQRQPLVLTEDPAVQISDVQAPPQRLAVSERSAKATRPASQNSTSRSNSQNQTRTRLANSRPDASVKQVAHSESAKARQTVAKQPANASAPLATSTQPSSYKPSRSEAVETLLAANRATTRSRQKPSTPATTQPEPTARIQSPAAETPAKTFLAKSTPSRANPSPANPSPANPSPEKPSPAKRAAKLKTENVAKTTTGKTVRFSDLPDDVKRRAMDRLIEKIAKEAVPSMQPTSLKQGVANALGNLPKLAPLRKTKPEVPPTRIASTRSVRSKPTASSRQVAEAPKQAQPTRALAKSSSTPARASVAVVQEKNPPPPSEPVVLAPKRDAAATAGAIETSGFQLPPMDQIRKSLPQLDTAKVTMASDSAARSFQWTLPTKTEVEASKTNNQTLSAAEIDSEFDRIQMDAESLELTVSALANEMEVIPHALERDSFRVSRVGLPDPDDYFAMVEAEVQQASSRSSDKKEPLQSVELANSVTRAASRELSTRAPQTLTPKTRSGELFKGNHLANESVTSAFDLPAHLDSKPKPTAQAGSQFELPVAKTVASVTKPSDLIKNLSENRAPAGLAVSPHQATADFRADPEEVAMPETSTTVVAQLSPQSLSDRELYDALLKRLSDPSKAKSPAEKSRRQIMARHLMVLAGDREAAVADMQGLSKEEQQFLRSQLEGLHAMVDPKGHPVAGRRFNQALPKLRQATQHLSAAADSLEVRGLEFCTEIEAYGQVKPFASRQFAAGQAVILYCEVDRFTAKKTALGYETHLKGSYDVFNQAGEKMVSQLLPADKQLSSNFLRDYFVAYQLNLPLKLTPGKYRMQLTMEDIGGEKYGQSEIEFEITNAAGEVRQTGGTQKPGGVL